LIEAQSGEGESVPKGRKGLAEYGIRLALQLREQAGKSRTPGRVDAAGRNQLVDQRLNALSA